MSVLFVSSKNGDLETLQDQIRMGCCLENKNANGATGLIVAAKNGHSACVDALISAGCEIDVRTRSRNRTALIFAAMCGRIECVRLLINAGCPLDVQDDEGCSALMWAVIKKNPHIVRLLLDAGCDTDLHTLNGVKETALMSACRYRAADSVELLIEAGCSLDLQDSTGNTALHWATKRRMTGNIECARLLVESGCQLDLRTNDDESVLVYALKKYDMSIARLLVAYGCGLEVSGNAHLMNSDVDLRPRLATIVSQVNANMKRTCDLLPAILDFFPMATVEDISHFLFIPIDLHQLQ